MKIRYLFILLFVSIALASCLQASNPKRNHSLKVDHSSIHSIELNNQIPLSGLIKELAKADYVLLGEAHDDPIHHYLQNKILEMLVEAGRSPAVVFEMLNREDEGLITSTARRFPDEPDKIAAAVNWQESGWPDWQMYRPIVKTALNAELPIVAGNLSRLKLKRWILNPASFTITEKTQAQLGLLQPLPVIHEQRLHSKIANAHGEKMPDMIIKGMLMAQRMRDATMAEAMIAGNLGYGAVLIAGQEHVRGDYGVPHYLRFREPEARIVSLAFAKIKDVANDKTHQSVEESPRPFDYVWVVPQGNGRLTAHR